MASPTEEAWQPLLDGLERLREAWPGTGWSWDPRFKCVTSSFGKEIADRARAAMAGVLDGEWSPDSINQAADEIRTLAARFGGVRQGQLLFTGEVVGGRMHLFALWWPWGDGATISLRVGVANCDRPTELFPKVRALFNIA
jgi:hypothetical protein